MSASSLLSISMLQFIAAHVVMVIIPGPVTFATGGLAVVHGFGKTIPLLAGIGIDRAVLTTLMAFGAIYLAAILSLPVVRICGAAVLCAMAWRMKRPAIMVARLMKGQRPTWGRVRTVRMWEALGGKLPFQIGSTGKVCLDRSRPHCRRSERCRHRPKLAIRSVSPNGRTEP